MYKSRALAHCAGLLACVLAGPALAQTIAAPAGDAGLWGALNGWLAPSLATAVTGSIVWIAARIHAFTGVTMTATLTEELRQTALTGLYKAAHELEVRIDGALTPELRQDLIARGVAWVMSRMPGPLGTLGIGQGVVGAVVTKMLGQAIGAEPVLDLPGPAVTGNPGETPALDRAAGR